MSHKAIHYMFNHKQILTDQFYSREDPNNPGYRTSGMSYDEYMEDMLERHGRGIVEGISLILVFPLC